MEEKDTLIRQNRVRLDASGSFGVGFIKVTRNDDEDLYHVWRLLSLGDYCEADTYRRFGKKDPAKVAIEVEIKNISFDGSSNLTVSGRVVSTASSVRIGAFHNTDLDKGKTFTLTKAKWDALDMEFLSRTTNANPPGSIGALILHRGVGQIFMIRESSTTLVWDNNRQLDEKKYFDEVMQGLIKTIDLSSVDHIIVGSEGSLQAKFYGHFFEKAAKEKLSPILENKGKFLIFELPGANRESLRSVFLDSKMVKRMKDAERRRPLLEVQSMRRFQNTPPNRRSNNEGLIIMFQGNITELLLSEQYLRQDIARRSQYGDIVRSTLRRNRQVTFFSPYHPWHQDLMEMGGVAAMFDRVVGEEEDEDED